jgi:DNA-binding PadR family transcriptional regulator
MRRPSNALALAVLALLYEQPMHPYQMSSTLRFRHKEDSIKINYGSLYAVVDSLLRNRLIEERERVREGRRPERTVYGLTAAGQAALQRWLGELVAVPSRQFTDFEAALSRMPALLPGTVGDLLATRLAALEAETEQYERIRATVPDFPRIFTIEGEYRAVLRAAETAFVRGLLADIVDGSFDGLAMWRRLHELKADDPTRPVMPALLAEFGDRLPPEPEVS